MRSNAARTWVMLLFGFALGTASGVTLTVLLARPVRRNRSVARPPDPALLLQ
ncbi:MAG: hypothetical protein RMK01_07770 [Thermomicrobium sp.]|nr:hypothetical protein [Thermomicrobium sp.]MDW8059959.1 hypothetical protein [Thermomicrobium sp.]